ncbi:HNH endonuclease [Halopenitus salinus]|uniref:HNH endonuclease n=1 Tax=Halopenitus salinus TaxID=1198295 RepID=A0ABD5UXD8_9EURY
MSNTAHQDRNDRFEQIALTVRNRDAGRCRRCGTPEGEERLSVHHLIPDSHVPDRFDAHLPVNLVSLCRTCHSELEPRSLDYQLGALEISDLEELLLSEETREAVNTRLIQTGPDELTIKPITKADSEMFLDADFADTASQRSLSEF